MVIPLATLIALVAHNAPTWLAALEGVVLDKSREVTIDKSTDLVVTKGGGLIRHILRLNEKEQVRHLEQALKNATERGLINFTTSAERDQYRDILNTLMQIGPQGEELRREALQLFTFSDTPDFTSLNERYNRSKRLTALAHKEPYSDIDTTPYLTSFFSALLAELYADPYFKQQMSETLQLRAAKSMQQSLLTVVALLQQFGEILEHDYTAEQLAQDVAQYTEHIERTLHNLKIIGIVPKDKNRDPELEGIFVPLRIQLQDPVGVTDQRPVSTVSILEAYPYLVLLGGPGSGKSTAIRYLAWSHAAAISSANQSVSSTFHLPLVPGCPLPLRIELRRLSEERRQHNYDFLSFATEVLLKREGVNIDQRMFKELLARRSMLLLFDGLDEVGTLDERIRLVEEIEHFTLHYPGNRVIVTSRPVGYGLAHFSNVFAHGQVQSFDDAQIQQFLQNWYSAVLGFSPIPHLEQKELDQLVEALQTNRRLHKLAENPLLLTVITQLHRYERLPDRRVLIYDRCADLLLETWAKVKGTITRWKEMRMVKEDQYACVAYLGSILHRQSQKEQQGGDTEEEADEITSDVTARVLLQETEVFLKRRNLIAEVAQQRVEAKLFIDLMTVEAGLIVERGTDENGETLYGFVHRTFQEYFAAADVYERLQQEYDLTIVTDFLVEHLHDPHWHEVILLLLGKLKSKPVTMLLHQILEGNIRSRRSAGTAILQQDLFLVCDCLAEEIVVENELVTLVLSRLSEVVQHSPFPSQRKLALEYLDSLMQTRQYTNQGQKVLVALLTTEGALNSEDKVEAIKVLYLSSLEGSEDRRLAMQMLSSLLKHSDSSLVQAFGAAMDLYFRSAEGSDEYSLAMQMFSNLLQRSDLSLNQVHLTTRFLPHYTLIFDDAFLANRKDLATEVFSSLPHCPDLSVDQISQTAGPSCHWSILTSSNRGSTWVTMGTLSPLFQHSNLSLVQSLQTIESLYQQSAEGSEKRKLATQALSTLLQRSDLSVDQTLQIIESFNYQRVRDQDEHKLATQVLSTLLQRSDLSVDQIRRITSLLYRQSAEDLEKRKLVTQVLSTLLQRSDLSVDQTRRIAESLCQQSAESSDEWKVALYRLLSLVQSHNLSGEWNYAYEILRRMVPYFHKLNL